MCQRSRPAVPDDATVVENLLKFDNGSVALSSREIGLAANVGGIKAGKIRNKRNLSNSTGMAACNRSMAALGFLVQFKLRMNRGQPQRLHLGIEWKPLI